MLKCPYNNTRSSGACPALLVSSTRSKSLFITFVYKYSLPLSFPGPPWLLRFGRRDPVIRHLLHPPFFKGRTVINSSPKHVTGHPPTITSREKLTLTYVKISVLCSAVRGETSKSCRCCLLATAYCRTPVLSLLYLWKVRENAEIRQP